MSNSLLPPDQPQREQALDPARSILVQAPAGSGKTDLLTRRFLCLLAEVEDPAQVVAITFTKAAAAEMRHRILSELEKAVTGGDAPSSTDVFSMDSLARRALKRSQALNWNLIDPPSQLRISTIDSFCRDLALQQPLLSCLGGGLDIAEQPEELYRRAARQTLENLDQVDPALRAAIEALLLWRDNNWQEMEKLLVQMLAQRDRWMRDFVLDREPDPEELRQRLERPFAAAVQEALASVSQMLDQVPGAREEVLALARFACEQSGNALHCELAELAEFPAAPFADIEALEEARAAWLALASLLLTGGGTFRKSVDKRLGFPADHKREKAQLLELIRRLQAVPGLEAALSAVRALPPSRYSEDEWQIVRSCFTLLRHAAGQLKVVFAEAGRVDYTEVAQTALHVLNGEEGLPSDTALALADGIRHILVDEFQDTSRRQHELLAHLIAAWPDPSGRTCFVVGDPMQSIYFFRDADAELFPRVREAGLELPNAEPLLFDSVRLKANFRTAPPLVDQLNEVFEKVFAADDGSGVTFSSAEPARAESGEPAASGPRLNLHLEFIPQTSHGRSSNPNAARKKEETAAQQEASRKAQTAEIVALIQSRMERMQQAHAEGKKYRIAVLGRTRSALAPVAEALRQAAIPFRAVDLEQLSTRPEVLDAVAMSRALLNPQDRVAWLGLLRAPWCGLSLADLHILTSADDSELLTRPVPDLLAERLPLLSSDGRQAAERVQEALAALPSLRFAQPAASLGTWLEQIWIRLGGAQCVDATARANLDLLWRCFDSLPEGEQDLLGPALGLALNKLAAQPDPDASSDCGVQLMTIHKSKGLEFEVVIIPDLQAGSGRGSIKLLSWLERGLAQPDRSGAITEFLVAPLQTKGADRGQAKNWVDRAYRERESQETRRILYVAATRAREELHIFARPATKTEKDGSLSLAEPTGSLLATAWPALEDEIRARFAAWQAETSQSEAAASPAEEAIIDSIAASGESNLLVMPSPIKPTLLLRLPPNYRPTQSNAEPLKQRLGAATSESWETSLFARHEGGLLSRALGTAIHTLLEKLAKLRETNDWEAARAALQQFEPRIAAEVRSVGVDAAKTAAIAVDALRHVLRVSQDPIGQWILSPHAEAASETRWAGVISGTLRTVQVDRVFRAGPEPGATGEEVWWIVDYKTAHPEGLDPQAALPGLRRLFSPQVESYAQVLRHLHGADAAIRAALYYPRMMALDWWEL